MPSARPAEDRPSPIDRARAAVLDARRQGRPALDEGVAKQLLDQFGIAVPRGIALPPEGASASDLDAVPAPWVLKLRSPDALHKSDHGYVALPLENASAVDSAIDRMRAIAEREDHRIDGFLLEECIHAPHEIVIGGLRNPTFGPMIMVGLGGVFVEVLRDVSFRLCPIDRLDAHDMLNDLKARALLDGARGKAPVPESVMVDALLAVGGENGLIAGLGETFWELDLNPVMVGPDGAIAVDARIILCDAEAEDSAAGGHA